MSRQPHASRSPEAFRLVLGLAFAAGLGSLAQAAPVAPLPPLDLGQTNILDGEGGPGRLLEIITFGSGAGRLADAEGHAAPGSNDQQVVSAVLHPILVSGASILGAHPGVEVLVPVSYVTTASRRRARATTPAWAT